MKKMHNKGIRELKDGKRNTSKEKFEYLSINIVAKKRNTLQK